jgi:aminoglycoside phosphotransferase (APT) family kinase protein
MIMTHIWQQTIFIDDRLASTLIEEQIGFKVKTISPLGVGFDNVAYLVNQNYVFRFPRRAMGVECIENEIHVLPYIAQHISFPFSCPEFIGTATEEYPAPFAGYRMLPGVPLCDYPAALISKALFAEKLAMWLKELHSIPPHKDHESIIKGDQTWRLSISQRSDRVIEFLGQYEQYFNDAGFQKDVLLSTLALFQSCNFDHASKTSYCHGDLYSRHIFADNEKQLSAIIDWGDIHIGHPGTDLSVSFMIFSDDALQVFFDTYGPVDDIMYKIALFRSFWHPIFLLPYCHEQKEKQLQNWTILALKKALFYCQKG